MDKSTELPVFLYSAFSNGMGGGNIGGVVVEEFPLEPSHRQTISRELAAPTTAFLASNHDGTFRVRFHSSRSEMDLCGHASVAAFAALLEAGHISAGIYKAVHNSGTLEVRVAPDGKVSLLQDPSIFGPCSKDPKIVNTSELTKLLGLKSESIKDAVYMPGGLRHLFIELEHRGQLRNIFVDNQRTREFCISNNIDTIGVWAPLPGSDCSNKSIQSWQIRDFCHGVGDPEEAASGTTNCALAAYLMTAQRLEVRANGNTVLSCHQGIEMGQPSAINIVIEASAGRLLNFYIEGSATKRMCGLWRIEKR